MRRIEIVLRAALTVVLALGLLAAPLAEAQESGKKARIGVLLLVPRNDLGAVSWATSARG